ncbi:MAG: hypothetical protein KJZ58_01285 [Flavobacteriales bacterium]|nr:hypothetical protein [Flavobacteriales bacterium]MCL4280871.1 hypothetical protein [Flavobacteriales bacterium]
MRTPEVLLDKEMVLRSVRLMPDHFSLDEFVDRMIVLEKIVRGIADIEAGRTFTLEEVRKRFAGILDKKIK